MLNIAWVEIPHLLPTWGRLRTFFDLWSWRESDTLLFLKHLNSCTSLRSLIEWLLVLKAMLRTADWPVTLIYYNFVIFIFTFFSQWFILFINYYFFTYLTSNTHVYALLLNSNVTRFYGYYYSNCYELSFFVSCFGLVMFSRKKKAGKQLYGKKTKTHNNWWDVQW